MLVFVLYVTYQENQRAQLALEAEALGAAEQSENPAEDSPQYEIQREFAESGNEATRAAEQTRSQTQPSPVAPIIPESRLIALAVATL